MPQPTPAVQLKRMPATCTPATSAQMTAAHATTRKLVPGAVEMVYDHLEWPGRRVGATEPAFGPGTRNTPVIKSVPVEQRPRRPAK
jgi:hypothetical protein